MIHREHFRHDHVLVTDTSNEHWPEVSQMGESHQTGESGPCMEER